MSINNKVILVTGGTGSFGQEFVKLLIEKFNPKKVIVFSRDEQKQYLLAKKIKSKKIRFFLGDVRDISRLDEALQDVDIVIHSAAQKHVDISEYNPFEAIKTNILGTKNIIEASLRNNVNKVIGLSTDKAVNPINLYGSTKLCSEKLLIAANNIKGKRSTSFSVVRYGNVLNSKGSVYEYFKLLDSKHSKYFPITHPDMTRFFITVKESTNFVIDAIKFAKGGEIIIPKMSSIKIVDLAKFISKNKKHKIIGIRPGEKIHEVLFSKDEASNVLEFKNFFLIQPSIQLNTIFNYSKIIGEKGKRTKLTEFSSSDKIKKWTKKIFLNKYES